MRALRHLARRYQSLDAAIAELDTDIRHCLNRGGNLQANSALWRIANTRMRTGAATKDYVTLCQAGGKNRKEIVRCVDDR